ncbi:hypothetical protein EVAR_88045_1 [Eumeta japonica]|uniref:Uncharacterized protein n=1 Tax=Eumeta variegata TaxID=151549 RepID=A0A4C1VFL5_EUMVA|nr:hypothetical protein EVAR_88045_1 [Eumeta japonica]
MLFDKFRLLSSAESFAGVKVKRQEHVVAMTKCRCTGPLRSQPSSTLQRTKLCRSESPPIDPMRRFDAPPTIPSSPPHRFLRHCDDFVANFTAAEFQKENHRTAVWIRNRDTGCLPACALCIMASCDRKFVRPQNATVIKVTKESPPAAERPAPAPTRTLRSHRSSLSHSNINVRTQCIPARNKRDLNRGRFTVIAEHQIVRVITMSCRQPPSRALCRTLRNVPGHVTNSNSASRSGYAMYYL